MKVFVHGVPETKSIWDPLVAELSSSGVDDVTLLEPPGFGVGVPSGWEATPLSYVAWLTGELERLRFNGAARIDLVGHDWGMGHVFGLLATRPDLVDSWAIDCGGLAHPDYEWHEAARTWQTKGAGEEAFDFVLSLPSEVLADSYVDLGMTPEVALKVAGAVDQTMVDCILSLYRAAVQPMLSDLGDRLARQVTDTPLSPGLILIAEEDTYPGTIEMALHTADRMGASSAQLDGVGHWWMCQDPAAAARLLVEHWKR